MAFLMAVCISASSRAQSPSTAPAGADAEAIVAQAGTALKENNYDEARRLLEPLVQAGSASPEAVMYLGFAYEQLARAVEQTSAAAPNAAQHRDLVNKTVDLYLRSGQEFRRAGNLRMAEEVYNRLLTIQPANPPAMLGSARVQAARGSRLRAIQLYRSYLKSREGQQDLDAHLEVARLYNAEGHWRLAVDVLEKLKPATPEMERELAQAYVTGQRLDKAKEHADRAARSEPDSPEARFLLAAVLLSPGPTSDPQKAASEAAEAVRLGQVQAAADPGDERLWRNLDQYFSQYQRALQTLLGQPGADPRLIIRLAQVIDQQGEVARKLSQYRALSVLKEVVGPSDPPPGQRAAFEEVLAALAERQLGMGQTTEAAETARRLLKLDENHPVARGILDAVSTRPAP
ncbi:MAG: hypothetical protein AMXMBFR13_15460 [Phycisphaerae bacterium]